MIDVSDPYFEKIFMHVVRMVAEDFQKRADTMTVDELYDNSDFFPAYNPDRHDYTQKPEGYTCRTDDGTIMRLVPVSEIGLMTLADGEDTHPVGPRWKRMWSKNPERAKPFVGDDVSPFEQGDCCLWEGDTYRCLVEGCTSSPEDEPNWWELVSSAEAVG